LGALTLSPTELDVVERVGEVFEERRLDYARKARRGPRSYVEAKTVGG
jgi:hypothetical protein